MVFNTIFNALYMSWMVVLFIVLGMIALWSWMDYTHSKWKCVRAGTNEYCPSNIAPIYLNIDGYKKKTHVAAMAAEAGPEWEADDILIVNLAYERVQRDRYYLMECEGSYRIARCTTAPKGLPEIFDRSETYLTHHVIGEVVAVHKPYRSTTVLYEGF